MNNAHYRNSSWKAKSMQLEERSYKKSDAQPDAHAWSMETPNQKPLAESRPIQKN